MPQNTAIDKAVADAKETLARVNRKFPPLPKEQPKEHEYSKTPYRMARPKKPTDLEKPKSEIDREIEGTGKSINYRLRQQKAVNKVLESK